MRNWLKLGIGLIGVFVLTVAVVYEVRFSVTDKDVAAARTKLEQTRTELRVRSAKGPIEKAAPAESVTPPADSFAALRALAARSKEAVLQKGVWQLISAVRKGTCTDAQWQEAAELLKGIAPLLEELRAFARNVGPCSVPQLTPAAWRSGMSEACYPHNMTMLLRLSAAVAAHAGDLDLAESDLAALFRLAGGLTPVGPIGSECWVTGYESLTSLFPTDSITQERGARLMAVARETFPDQAEFADEFVSEVEVFSMFFSDEFCETNHGNDPRWAILISRPFRITATADMMAVAQDLMSISGRPYYEVRGQLEAIRAREVRAGFTNPMAWKKPIFTDIYVGRFENEARLGLLSLGLAVEAYRNEHGTFPAALDAVAASVGGTLPLDPFSGKPFVYRATGDGFILYSVGPNQADDGGSADDLAWRQKKATEPGSGKAAQTKA